MSLRPVLAAAFALMLGLAATTAGAQIYRWTDEKGRVHITDTPPPASARNVQKQKAVGNIVVPAQTSHELAQAVKSFPVTLYTSPACKEACASARTALNQRGVPFNEVQVWDEQTNAQLKQVSGRNDVPTLVVGRSVQVGFEQGAFDALLDSARYPKAGAVPPGSQVTPEPPEGYTPPPGAAQPVQPEPEAPEPAGPYAPKAPPPARQ